MQSVDIQIFVRPGQEQAWLAAVAATFPVRSLQLQSEERQNPQNGVAAAPPAVSAALPDTALPQLEEVVAPPVAHCRSTQVFGPWLAGDIVMNNSKTKIYVPEVVKAMRASIKRDPKQSGALEEASARGRYVQAQQRARQNMVVQRVEIPNFQNKVQMPAPTVHKQENILPGPPSIEQSIQQPGRLQNQKNAKVVPPSIQQHVHQPLKFQEQKIVETAPPSIQQNIQQPLKLQNQNIVETVPPSIQQSAEHTQPLKQNIVDPAPTLQQSAENGPSAHWDFSGVGGLAPLLQQICVQLDSNDSLSPLQRSELEEELRQLTAAGQKVEQRRVAFTLEHGIPEALWGS